MTKAKQKTNTDIQIINPINLDHNVPSLISILGGRLALHSLRYSTRNYDMGIRGWRIIHILGFDGPSTINEVAGRVAMDQGGTSRSIAKLERRGLIIRRSDADDRRLSRVALSAEGARLHNEIAKFSHEREQHLLSKLSKQELRELDRMLTLLSDEANNMLDVDWNPDTTDL
jgi:DNA-binding MarR family transcriptional regulator